ncbi:MAG: hypothetical protein H0W61_10360 [Bacteroidetes bacterium]|nr:hypothetical protein [Bacteroidota bacterium]
MRRKFIFVFFLSFISIFLKSQIDTVNSGGVKNKKAVYQSARRASILSAVIPGLGQAYNGKYWKIPVIYAGLGGLGYFFYVNNTHYNNYRAALIQSQVDGGTAVVDGRVYSTSQLQTQKLYYRKFRDFAGIGIAALYILNIIDANVDAHLKTFDVSDDLSLSVDPWQGSYSTARGYKTVTGISIKLNFK